MTTPDAALREAIPPTPPRRRILLVDDNLELAQTLKELLEGEGHQVAIAIDPLAALEMAGKVTPEVCILDIELPIMDGYELAKRLRELSATSDTLLVALTGYGWEHDSRRSQEAGFAHHLVKPVDTARLIRIVEGAA